MTKRVRIKRKNIKIRYDFPEKIKDGSIYAIFGCFAGINGSLTDPMWMSCFWTKHGYERDVKEGWVVDLLEGFWCVEPIAWIETEIEIPEDREEQGPAA